MKTNLIKSPLRYPGGKFKVAHDLAARLPESFDEYREAFVGGGSLFLYLKQQRPDLKIWINDLNPEVYLFWTIAQSHNADLVQEIRMVKREFAGHERELYEYLSTVPVTRLSALERAARFFLLNRITFSGTIESGGFSQSASRNRFTHSSIDRLEAIGPLLEGVMITHCDYQIPAEAPGENVVVYFDPPYEKATPSRLYGRKGDLHLGFDHDRFVKILRGSPHQWLVTYDDTERMRRRLDFANLAYWELPYGMNNYRQEKAERGKELIATNF